MKVKQFLFQERWWEGGVVACLIFNQWPHCMNGSYPPQHVCLEIKKIPTISHHKIYKLLFAAKKMICGNLRMDMQINSFMFKHHADSTDFILHQGGLICHFHLEAS